jgi:hypothetical protein
VTVKFSSISAIEILDSRGRPTLSVSAVLSERRQRGACDQQSRLSGIDGRSAGGAAAAGSCSRGRRGLAALAIGVGRSQPCDRAGRRVWVCTRHRLPRRGFGSAHSGHQRCWLYRRKRRCCDRAGPARGVPLIGLVSRCRNHHCENGKHGDEHVGHIGIQATRL